LFGCRPLGPVGLGLAFGSGGLATGASVVAPPLVAALQRRWAERRPPQGPAVTVEIRLGP